MNAMLKPTGYRELLLGCGNSRKKRVTIKSMASEWHGLTTLDMDESCNPDVVHDLDNVELPFEDNSFDEIHAYEVLEHCGRQGDWRFFFAQWSEFYRIIRPGGYFCGTCPDPDSVWALGDPGHTRIIQPENLIFLNQEEYKQVGTTPMTDYRRWYKGDFQSIALKVEKGSFGFVLEAVKPSRCSA